MSKLKIAGVAAGLLLLVVVVGWASTAPYLSNQGLGRTPGIFIGGTLTPPLDDFSPLNDSVHGPMMFKLAGFPPFVNYLSWVGMPDGVITATPRQWILGTTRQCKWWRWATAHRKSDVRDDGYRDFW